MDFLYIKIAFMLLSVWFLGWFLPFGIQWLNRQQAPVTLRPEGLVQYFAHIVLIVQHLFVLLLLLNINPFFFLPFTAIPVELNYWQMSISVTGLLLYLVANYIRRRAILEMGSMFEKDVLLKADHTLINSGLFRKCRHPIYVGNLLGEFSLGLIFLSWPISLITLVISFPVWNHRADVEELLLAHKFEQIYSRYRREVKRWGLF